jgi:hypothetical protein
MTDSLKIIFGKNRNIIIGAIHFPPLFGYPEYPGFDMALEYALQDLKAFEDGGVDSIIIENNYDTPHKIFVENETVDLMIKLGKEIKNKTDLPLGVSVLWNDYKAALLIAKKIGGQFIRVPVFVDNVKTNYGDIFADPKEILEYRKKIEAENIKLFTDIHVKHAELLDKKTIEESAKEAVNFNSDALIITGKWTGDAPKLDELRRVRNEIGNFPILIGSGADENNIKNLLEYANGVIISTSLKEGEIKENEINIKTWKQRIDKNKVVNLINKQNLV